MKKSISLLLIVMITLTFLSACNNSSDQPQSTASSDDSAVESTDTIHQDSGSSESSDITPEGSSASESTETVPEDSSTDESTNAIPEDSGTGELLDTIPEAYIGQWEGSVDNISLSFNVESDGTGIYTFDQSGYTESYDFTLEAGTETFSVKIPANNTLNIQTIEGTYTYSDEMLILAIQTTFVGGNVFKYTVPCQKV